MRRVLFGVLAIVLLYFGVRAIVHFFASDETKIRWVIEDMVDGFNETRMNPIMYGLSQDFVDEGSSYKKDDVRTALAQMFLQAKDPKTKRFPYRVHVPEEVFHVQVHEGKPRTAETDCGAGFEEFKGEEWAPRLLISVHAKWVLEAGGWKIHSARIDKLDGKPLR